MEIGMTHTERLVVTEELTARHMGSGVSRVFATPAMIALMEKAAMNAVAGKEGEGCVTVGVHIDAAHEAATPVGMEVFATAKLIKIDGRKLEFEIAAFDEKGAIGSARHERVIVNDEKFTQRAYARLEG